MSNDSNVQGSWALSRKRGWLLWVNDEQSAAWQQECFSNGRDCFVVRKTEDRTSVWVGIQPGHQLSDIGHLELKELLRGYDTDLWSSGLEATASEFRFDLPSSGALPESLDDIRELLLRDRTHRRRVERQHQPGLVEGLAIAVDCTGLWEDHPPRGQVYVLEMEGRPGRCVVFKSFCPPLVDLPLSSFRLLAERD